MARITLTLHDVVAHQIRDAVSSGLEVAGVLIVGTSETPGELRLLGREYHPAPDEAYVERTPRRLRLSSAAYMPALARAQTLGATAIFVHSHPEEDPTMSPSDDGVDASLRTVFQIRTDSSIYGSLVLRLRDGNLSFSGRVWRNDDLVGAISLLREVGERFTFTSSVDALAPLPRTEAFDRQVRAFGGPIQDLLGSLHIGIAGCGGTGSSVAEQLIRLGVGRLTVVDHDVLTNTNVTRVYGSGITDAGQKKVEIVRRNANRIGLDTLVETIDGKVSVRSTMDALRACDIIFGCTDDQTGRLDLARLAYWCLVPVLDVGVLVDSTEGALDGIYCRLSVQIPGTACVQCWGLIDQARLGAEQLSAEEREELEHEGYAPELETRDPAVIAYTTLVSATAVSELILRLTGAAIDGAARIMIMAHDRRISTASKPLDRGHWCGQPQTWGIGVTRRHYLGRAGWPS